MGTMYLDSGGGATNSGTSDNNSPDLSGSANAAVTANKTFVDADVNTATDVISIASHGFSTGFGAELTTTGVLPAGLVLFTIYYLNCPTSGTLTLHTNLADALAGTNPVNITAAAGGGTHTLNNRTVSLGGSPNLSAVRGNQVRLTTTGLSHVFSVVGNQDLGLSDGDELYFIISSGGTIPTGVVAAAGYYVTMLTPTTFRIHHTKALALAGGASLINVSAVEVRSLFVALDSQSAIYLADATNTNRKIFWIIAVDDANDRVIVDLTPTGVSTSNWAIGGRINTAGIQLIGDTVRPSDRVIQNTDISANPLNLTLRGPSYNGSVAVGILRWEAPSTAVKLLVNQGNGILITMVSSRGLFLVASYIEFQSQGTGNTLSWANNGQTKLHYCRITDGATGLSNNSASSPCWLFRSEISGVTDALGSNAWYTLIECYVHDVTNVALMASSGPAPTAIGCIFERCGTAVRLEFLTAVGVPWLIYQNTIYRCTVGGVIVASPSAFGNAYLVSNVIVDNGDAATEANLNIASTKAGTVVERDNLVSIAGARGGVNTLNFTLDASDITSDPLFADPDAAVGSRNFGLRSNSPAKGISYTFQNSLSVSYKDLGAVQSFPRSPRAQHMIGA